MRSLLLLLLLAVGCSVLLAAEDVCAMAVDLPQTDGVVQGVKERMYSIGYAGLDSIVDQDGDVCALRSAKMVNKAGKEVEANIDTVLATLRSKAQTLMQSPDCPGFGFCTDMMDADDANSWPITTLTWFVIPLVSRKEHNCQKLKLVQDYTRWVLTSDKARAAANLKSFSTMPELIAKRLVEEVDKMMCDGVLLTNSSITAAYSAHGAGSSLQGAIQDKMMSEFFLETSQSLSYDAIGSGGGLEALGAGESDFAGSESIVRASMPGAVERNFSMIPVLATAVGIMHNSETFGATNLVLSREAVNGIFTGEITSWNDTRITDTNSELAVGPASNPSDEAEGARAIIRVVRRDKSGTTESFARALHHFSGGSDIQDHVLKGKALPEWPNSTLPLPDGTRCVVAECKGILCGAGTALTEVSGECLECRQGTSMADTAHRHMSCIECFAESYTPGPGAAACVPCSDMNGMVFFGKCVPVSIALPSIIIPCVVILAIGFFWTAQYIYNRGSHVYLINEEDLHLCKPPEVLGNGVFGLVLKAEYRGTFVAVKRVLPTPSNSEKQRNDSQNGPVKKLTRLLSLHSKYSDDNNDNDFCAMEDVTMGGGTSGFLDTGTSIGNDETLPSSPTSPPRSGESKTVKGFPPAAGVEPLSTVQPPGLDIQPGSSREDAASEAPLHLPSSGSSNSKGSKESVNKESNGGASNGGAGSPDETAITIDRQNSTFGLSSMLQSTYRILLRPQGKSPAIWQKSRHHVEVKGQSLLLPESKKDENISGLWSGQITSSRLRKMNDEFLAEIRLVSKIRHPCITTVMGAVTSRRGTRGPLLVMEYMEFGSLRDLVKNKSVPLEGEILLPVLSDVSQGMRFLHSAKPPIIHTDLKAANVLVDSNFRGKVTDFGLSQKRRMGAIGTPFFVAPELLRYQSMPSKETDVYSFAITLSEVFSRKDPYHGENCLEVLREVADSERVPCKRPEIPEGCPARIASIMQECWLDAPSERPTFDEIDRRIRSIDAKCIIPSLLEEGRRTKGSLESSNKVLLDMFPKHIAEALKEGRKVEPERKECVTVFFSDIVGFTSLSSRIDSTKVSDLLDRLYEAFDEAAKRHNVYKIETIGDAYLAVTNLIQDQPTHAVDMAMFGTEAVNIARQILVDPDDPSLGTVRIRVGLHSGPVVASVIGSTNLKYTLLGDTMNTASRMESMSLPLKVQCSLQTAKLIKAQDSSKQIKLTSRGQVTVKGKGQMRTFWVQSRATAWHLEAPEVCDSNNPTEREPEWDGLESVPFDAILGKSQEGSGSGTVTWDDNMRKFHDKMASKNGPDPKKDQNGDQNGSQNRRTSRRASLTIFDNIVGKAFGRSFKMMPTMRRSTGHSTGSEQHNPDLQETPPQSATPPHPVPETRALPDSQGLHSSDIDLEVVVDPGSGVRRSPGVLKNHGGNTADALGERKAILDVIIGGVDKERERSSGVGKLAEGQDLGEDLEGPGGAPLEDAGVGVAPEGSVPRTGRRSTVHGDGAGTGSRPEDWV